jgi:hypothetical protein
MLIGNRNAQVKMGETVAIMFVFFILLVVGAVFYMNLQRTSVAQDITAAYELRAVELAQTISFLPEVQCSESNVIRQSCFDLYKMIGLSNVSHTQKGYALYENEFGQTKVELIVVYPHNFTFTLYDNVKTNFTSAPVSHIPISLYNASSDQYYFGVLEITVYQ